MTIIKHSMKIFFSFPAGSYGKLNNQKIKIKKYWDLEIKDQIDFDKKNLRENLRKILNCILGPMSQ